MATPKGKRLIQIGLASLYNRKANNSIKYLYRRVGGSSKEKYSFRWQPQFAPNNNTDPEYMKKRIFSWITKRRSDRGELPDSTTSKNWPKAHRKNPDWRAAHYFWSYRTSEFERRMEAETEDADEAIKRFAKFYQKYIRDMDLPRFSRMAVNDLLRRMKQDGNNKIGKSTHKTIIRSSDGAAARSKEEQLIYLSPHLSDAQSKGLISSNPEEKEIMNIISRTKFPPVRKQQLDIKTGTVESQMIETFIKSRQKEIMTRAADKKAFVNNMGAGTEVTQKTLEYRWKEATRKIDMKQHKTKDNKVRFQELMTVVSTMEEDINNANKPDVELRGEAERRFRDEAKSEKMYTYTIPTAAGDLVLIKVAQKDDAIQLTGGMIPNVEADMGTAAANHMLGAATVAVTKRVLNKLDTSNAMQYGNDMMSFTETEADRLLWMRNPGSKVTENVYAPTYSVNIMSEGDFARCLSTLVNDAFGAYYNQGTWQNFFDPQSQYSENNAFRQWATEWINKSKALTKDLQELADNDTNWKPWMQRKVKSGTNPWSWTSPVQLRPFVFTSKRGQLQRQASLMTAQGRFTDYRTALMSL
jgi:hypothetical protein